MNDWTLFFLVILLILLIFISAFFSSAETSLMSLNRYRLRHRARQGDAAAKRTLRLLDRPDRLLGFILIGNNFVNTAAAAIATVIALQLGGDAAIPIATVLLTIVLLIFGEIGPKTVAALRPEQVAYPASTIIAPLMWLFAPLVWALNSVVDLALKPLGIHQPRDQNAHLSMQELRTVVLESGALIPREHQKLLLSIFDLDAATVEDIMVPRNEVVGLDLDDPWERNVAKLAQTHYTRMPVYRGDLNQVSGFLHMRQVVRLIHSQQFNEEQLEKLLQEPYFIPEGTPLHRVLVNLQQNRQQIGLVVDEYGDVMGLVTLEDLLEEIVGEFANSPNNRQIKKQIDGSYLINAGITIRALNRALNWNLPTDGPKTLGGLILETTEAIPPPGTCLELLSYGVEIMETGHHRIKTVKMRLM